MIKFLFAIFIFIFLLYKIGFRDVLSKVISLNPVFYLIVFLILLVTLVIGAYNIKILVNVENDKIPFKRIFYYNTLSWSIGLFVPGKIGEFSLVHLLKKEKISMGKASVIFLLDKIISLIVFLFFSMIGFIIFLDFSSILKLNIVIFILGLCFLFFVVFEKGRYLIKRYVLRKYATEFEGFSDFLFLYFRKEKLLLLKNFILTFLKWFVNSFNVYILLLAYNQNISVFYVFLINAMLMIVSLIPITISGLGIGQSVAILLYKNLFNIEPSLVLSVYLIPLIIAYLIAVIIIISSLKKSNPYI